MGDIVGGSAEAERQSGILEFKQRSVHVQTMINNDREMFNNFARRMSQTIDAIAEDLNNNAKLNTGFRAKTAEDQMAALKAEIASLVPRVDAGGRKARSALIRLISLATEPNAKSAM